MLGTRYLRLEADPDKIQKVKSWSTLTTLEQSSQFLCFVGYYRKLLKVLQNGKNAYLNYRRFKEVI